MITEIIKDMSLMYAPHSKHSLEMVLFRLSLIEIWATHPEQISEINKLKEYVNKDLEYVNSQIKEEQAS